MVLGILAVQAVAVALGSALGAFLPERAVALASAALFVAVAAWLWWDGRTREAPAAADGDRQEPAAPARGGTASATRLRTRVSASAVLAVAAAFAVGELGDKTQLATVALASRQDWSATLLGGVVGMTAANALAVEAGARLGRLADRHLVQRVSAAVFALAGVVLAVLALVG